MLACAFEQTLRRAAHRRVHGCSIGIEGARLSGAELAQLGDTLGRFTNMQLRTLTVGAQTSLPATAWASFGRGLSNLKMLQKL